MIDSTGRPDEEWQSRAGYSRVRLDKAGQSRAGVRVELRKVRVSPADVLPYSAIFNTRSSGMPSTFSSSSSSSSSSSGRFSRGSSGSNTRQQQASNQQGLAEVECMETSTRQQNSEGRKAIHNVTTCISRGWQKLSTWRLVL